MNSEFTVLGVNMSYDFGDADDVEKLETALQKAKDEILAVDPKLTASASIRALCKPYHDMFETVFGPEKKEEIFKGKTNYGDCIEAMQDLIEAEKNGMASLRDMGNANEQKPMNRKQRRAQMRAMNAYNSAVK